MKFKGRACDIPQSTTVGELIGIRTGFKANWQHRHNIKVRQIFSWTRIQCVDCKLPAHQKANITEPMYKMADGYRCRYHSSKHLEASRNAKAS